jgi:hypothetical protein
MELFTPFGLHIRVDGINNFGGTNSEMYLCSDYSNHVCGLFGNANGNTGDDFQNPQGQNVPLQGGYYQKFYRWGSTWRHGQDNDIDIDGQTYDSVFILI